MTRIASRCVFVIIAIALFASASQPLQRVRRAAFARYATPWPDGVIPYKVDRSWSNNELMELQFAMQTWNQETCLQFRPYRDGDKSWILIKDGSNCEATVGYLGRQEQYVTLAKYGCRYYGLYLHELGHAIGLRHEHVRPNRDEYIKVNLFAVNPGYWEFFNKHKEESLLTYNTPYDLQSVMHYGSNSFIMDADKPAIQVRNPDATHLLRDVYANVLSYWDAKVVNHAYKCQSRCRNPPGNCPYPGFIDQHCRCQTPSEFARRWCVDQLGATQCKDLVDQHTCSYNFGYMAINCRKTCGICFTDEEVEPIIAKPLFPACQSGDPPGCPEHITQCTSVEIFRWCPNVCQNCDTCDDVDDRCAKLHKINYCTLHPLSMVPYCRKTCGACDV